MSNILTFITPDAQHSNEIPKGPKWVIMWGKKR